MNPTQNDIIPASATIIVKNGERYLEQVLTSLQAFDEILLLDNGSTDRTLNIAQQFANTTIVQHAFIGFGALKNLAAEKAHHDWIFSIDSDEIPDSTLINAIRQAVTTNQPQHIYSLNRLNHYHGRLIKACGWYPDILPRLYHKQHTHFTPRRVHESLIIPSDSIVTPLAGSLKHYSFDNASDLINKMQHYSSLYAEENQHRKASSLGKALLHGISAFVKNYLLKRGICYGTDGFIIASANAQGSYYKYIKLLEANRQLSTALIITTYNHPDALAAVLHSALNQTHRPDEILIADDGSDERTAATIARIAQNSPIPIKHLWQEDRGFRLSQSRNRAIAASQSDYLIMIDGDMVLHPKFIQHHLAVAQRGRFIQGSRVLMDDSLTEHYLNSPTPLNAFRQGIRKRHAALNLPWLRQLIAHKGKQSHKGIKGCNIAFFKADAQAINGFDNQFIGWGREDSEFVARLYHNGVKRHDLKFGGIAYHLYHPESERDALPENQQRLEKTLNEKRRRCEDGLNAFDPSYEPLETTMTVKAIAFDLDGTLIDSLPDLARAANHLRQHYQLNELSEAEIQSYIGDGAIELVHRVLTGKKEGRDPERIEEAFALYRDYYRKHLTIATRLYPQVRETLAELHQRHIPLAVVTNKPEAYARTILEHFQLSQYFRAIYGGDTFSERKPHPMPLQEAAKIMNIAPEEMLMVGDSANDILSGKAAGSPTALLSYGYGETDELVQNPATKADYLLHDIQSLLDLL